MSLRVLITGSRDWTDFETIFKALDDALSLASGRGVPLRVVHGAARGADSIAQAWYDDRKAKGVDVQIERHPAKWTTLGKRAGTVRNLEMIALGAEMCLAFPLPESIGTRHCMRHAQLNGIPVYEFAPRDSDIQAAIQECLLTPPTSGRVAHRSDVELAET